MKYHDSLQKAQKIMVLSIEQLEQWQLPINPINYSVSYIYSSKNNNLLSALIDEHIKTQQPFTNFFFEELYNNHVLDQHTLREGIVNELDDVLKIMNISCQQSSSHTTAYLKKLDELLNKQPPEDITSITALLDKLKTLTVHLKDNQQQLLQQLTHSQEVSRSLRVELKEVRKEIELDPVTGLYNRKTMTKHLEHWHQEDPNKQIAVIVIRVNELDRYNKKFGSLLSDVILSKVANKISSYVNNSGIPIRITSDEFLILMPEIGEYPAKEVAEKISLGVEKLRFVSVQTGVQLPKMTISIGITSKVSDEVIDDCIDRARHRLEMSELTNDVN